MVYLPHEGELSHTWLFPGILFLPRKHIQIKIVKLAKNLVLLAIDPVALPSLPRNPVIICVHRLIVPSGAPQSCPGSVTAKLLLLSPASSGCWVTPEKGTEDRVRCSGERGCHGESIWYQRDGAEDTAALQPDVLYAQQGPPCLLGGSHILWEHREHWEAHMGNPEPKTTSQTTCLWHSREGPRNFPLCH